MANLENSIFLPPDKLAVQSAEMFVRYPVEEIAIKRNVRALWLHLSLPGSTDAPRYHIREVRSPWEADVFQSRSYPVCAPRLLALAYCPPFVKEDAVSIDPVLEHWLFQPENYGLHITNMNAGSEFNISKPPYLEIVFEPVRAGVGSL